MYACRLTAIAIGVAGLALIATASAVTFNDIVSRGSVRIGVLTGAPPMGMVDERGNPAGYDVDVANLVGKLMGCRSRWCR